MPSNAGFIVTKIDTSTPGAAFFEVLVNGVAVRRGYLDVNRSWRIASNEDFITVFPGATIEIRAGVSGYDLNIAGYFVTLADLGLE